MADEGRIQVQLSLLSAQDSAAAKQLADSLGQIAKMFEALKASDFRQTAEKMAQLHSRMLQEHDRIANQVQSNAPQGGRSTPQEAARQGVDLVDYHRQQQEQRDRTEAQRREAERQRQSELKDTLRSNQAERQAQRDQTAQAEAERRREERARLDAAHDEARNQPRNAVNKYMESRGLHAEVTEGDGGVDLARGGFRIPRFGELNPQDFLASARDSRLRRALEQDEHGNNIHNPEQVQKLLGQANLAQRGFEGIGTMYAARHAYRQINQHVGFNAGALTAGGAGLGYQRDTNAFSDILGMQTPFSAAGAEGWRQFRDTQKMRFSGGINREEAEAITGASQRAGFGGDLGSDIRMEFLAPMFRRFGGDPNQLAPFTQILRTGTGSIEDLNNSLSDLGETARAANMGIDETAQSLASAGEAAQGMGGSYLRGVEYGRAFMQGTGLPADVGNTLGQNPTVQAFISAKTGLPSMVHGALPANVRMEGMRDALAARVGAFDGVFGDREDDVTDLNGKKIGIRRTSGRDMAIGAAADQLGISQEQAKAIMSRTDRQRVSETFGNAASAYEEALNPLLGRQSQTERRDAVMEKLRKSNNWFDIDKKDLAFDSQGRLINKSTKGNPVVADREEVVEAGREWAAERTGNKGPTFGSLRGIARQAGVDQEDIDNVKKGDTKKLRQLISDRHAEQNAKYHIAFTGTAEKYFKALAREEGWDTKGWEEPPNVTAASAPGSKPLTETGHNAAVINRER